MSRQRIATISGTAVVALLVAGCTTTPPAQPSSAPPITRATETDSHNGSAASARADEEALRIAANKGDTNTVKSLLEKGVNVNAKDESGRTALTEAAWNGHNEIIKLLLDKNADVNAKKNDGETALSLAVNRQHKETADLLRKAVAQEASTAAPQSNTTPTNNATQTKAR